MRARYLLLALLALGLVAPVVADEVAVDTEEKKMFYAIGNAVAQGLAAFDLSDEELELVVAGLRDGVKGEPAKADPRELQTQIQALMMERRGRLAEKEKSASAEFVAAEGNAQGAVVTPSGLVFTSITPGSGATPAATDTVRVHYRGTLRTGDVFDSSYDRGQPVEFPLDGVIPCWTEALQLMKVGGKAKLVCPAEIAYGERGRPGIPGNAALVFEVELLDIVVEPAEAPAPTPPE